MTHREFTLAVLFAALILALGLTGSALAQARTAHTVIAGTQSTCVFGDLRPGTYAVAVVHEENGSRFAITASDPLMLRVNLRY